MFNAPWTNLPQSQTIEIADYQVRTLSPKSLAAFVQRVASSPHREKLCSLGKVPTDTGSILILNMSKQVKETIGVNTLADWSREIG